MPRDRAFALYAGLARSRRPDRRARLGQAAASSGRSASIYRPETERASHYFHAILPQQFDEYIWFDDTRAVTPFDTAELAGLPDTYPFGV